MSRTFRELPGGRIKRVTGRFDGCDRKLLHDYYHFQKREELRRAQARERRLLMEALVDWDFDGAWGNEDLEALGAYEPQDWLGAYDGYYDDEMTDGERDPYLPFWYAERLRRYGVQEWTHDDAPSYA